MGAFSQRFEQKWRGRGRALKTVHVDFETYLPVEKEKSGPILVVRVEHPENGKGPCTSGRMSERTFGLLCRNGRRPEPLEDGLDHCTKFGWVFGVHEPWLLTHWFGRALGPLHDEGFVIRAYEANKYDIGKSEVQVGFVKEQAELVQEFSILEFINKLSEGDIYSAIAKNPGILLDSNKGK